MKKGTLYIFTGPSGTGKGTMLRHVLDHDKDLFLSISATTREPRVGEVDGEHYFFLSKEEFEAKAEAGEFLECAEYVGNYYGTLEAPVQKQLDMGRDVILEIEVQGALQVSKARHDAVMIFVAPPNFEELARRLKARATEKEEVVQARLQTALNELSHQNEFDYIIVNEDLEQAIKDLEAIFKVGRMRNKNK